MERQSGFTLIELVVVIVILGILAAFALPKFVDLQVEARNATVRGLKGSLHGAASLAHAKSLATANSTSITVEGQSVALVNGYPEASGNGIINMLQDLSGFQNSTPAGSPQYIDFWPNGASAPSECQVRYTQPNATVQGDAPDITITTTNCS